MESPNTSRVILRDILITDFNSPTNRRINYITTPDDENVNVIEENNDDKNNFRKIKHIFSDIFLPKGYPDSVSDDYFQYQLWDTCQAFCSSISGTLTVRSVMEGIGVGSEKATPLSAAITWLIRDGTAMFGSVFFTWMKGSRLDSDSKKWRLFADVLNDIAMFIELYVPYVAKHSTLMFCTATLFKSVVGTAGSSTRMAIVTHQAIKGNIADVSAKDGSQEIFTNLMAFLFGVLVLKYVTETREIWALMCVTSLFHLIFNYKAVKSLNFKVFNNERYRLVLRSYLPTSVIPTVTQVSRQESVLLGLGISDIRLCGFHITFGKSLENFMRSPQSTSFRLNKLMTFFRDKNYLIFTHLGERIIQVCLTKDFENKDILKAYFHAVILGASITHLESGDQVGILERSRKHSTTYRLKNILKNFANSAISLEEPYDSIIYKAYLSCQDFVEKEFTVFYKSCKDQGWDVNNNLFIMDDWRVEYTMITEEKSIEQPVVSKTSRRSYFQKMEKLAKANYVDYRKLTFT